MLKLTNLNKEYTNKQILIDANLFISPDDKVGIVGPNGAGKTTLMKILVKKEEYDSGSVYIQPNTSITYLSQELPEFKKRTLIDEVRNTFPEIVMIQTEINHIEERMQIETHEDKLDNLVSRYSHLQEELKRLDAQAIEIEMFKVVRGLGFTENDFEKPLGDFSGGWQMRVALAKLLLEKPNLLLLDEPTNHLDIEAIEWLEKYLIDYDKAFILVSHDKRFLDKVVTRIVELENGILTDYPGNYSTYKITKEKNLESLISAKERQDQEIKRMETFVERFRASATKSTQAKSREKMLNKIERIELPKESDSINFKFPQPKQTGRIVLKINNISKTYGFKKVLDSKKEVWIERGNKIALIGANGTGKSTLMKMIIGIEKPDSGNIEYGHGVEQGYFAQNQSEKLNSENTAIEELYEIVPEYTLTQVRTLLGRFLFKNERAFQEIKTLSGGEKSRLAIAKMLLNPANFILMDEPTNHLDIPSKDVLIDALQQFQESFMVISHDRDFIAQTCNRIFEIRDGEIFIYEGNYDSYIEQKEKEVNNTIIQKAKEETEEPSKVQVSKEYRNEQKEKQKLLTSLEKSITKIEDRIKVLESDLADPEIYNDSEKMVKLTSEYNKLKLELDDKYSQWEELAI